MDSLFTLGFLCGTAFGCLCALAVYLIASYLGDLWQARRVRRAGYVGNRWSA